jgi:hypothetical protein
MASESDGSKRLGSHEQGAGCKVGLRYELKELRFDTKLKQGGFRARKA